MKESRYVHQFIFLRLPYASRLLSQSTSTMKMYQSISRVNQDFLKINILGDAGLICVDRYSFESCILISVPVEINRRYECRNVVTQFLKTTTRFLTL